MNPQIDTYLLDGCMRCHLGATPGCKVHQWREELKQLRRIILSCGLNEELKWGVPCYTFQGKNIAIVSAFKNFASLSFFKGVLLTDPLKMLAKAGENSQSASGFKFTDVRQILANEPIIKSYVLEAIDLEREGKKVHFKEVGEFPIPEELIKKFNQNQSLEIAFRSLTPGRQRGYLLFFSAPKQSKTRESRIEKSIPNILQGKGIHD